MRFLNFTAVDTGTIDSNGKPIIEYTQYGEGLSAEEKAAASRWLLQEITMPMIPGKIKVDCLGVGGTALLNDGRVINPTDEKQTRSLRIYNYLQDKMRHDPCTNVRVFDVMKKLKALNPGDTYLEAYEGHYQRNGDKFLDYYHILHELAKKFSFDHVMEIGCRTGISICQLLSALKDNGREMPKTIDLFDVFNDGFISPMLVKINVNHIAGGICENIRFHIGDSKKTVPEFKPDYKLDWILVDGDHSREGAMADLINVEPLIAPGGIICFDDVSPNIGECNLIGVWNDFKKGREDKYYWLESMVGKGFALAICR
jgi:predicted O-methyltransferase YrrM